MTRGMASAAGGRSRRPAARRRSTAVATRASAAVAIGWREARAHRVRPPPDAGAAGGRARLRPAGPRRAAARPCAAAARGRRAAARSGRCRRARGPRRRSARCRRRRRARGAGSTMWSPLQALTLSSNTGPETMPGGAVPRRAVALVEADEEVRRLAQVGAVVELRRVEDLADPDVGALLVPQAGEPGDQLVLEPLRLRSRGDDPLRLAPLEVEVEPGQAERVGARLRPVHVAQPLALAVRPRLQREVAVGEEPGVEVHAAAEGGEAVVGEDHQHVARRAAAPRPCPPARRCGRRASRSRPCAGSPRARARPGGPPRCSARTCAGCGRWRRRRR